MSRHSIPSNKRTISSRQRTRSRKLIELFLLRDQGRSVSQVARQGNVSRSFVSKRYTAYCKARREGDQVGMELATVDKRGTHKRIFTHQEEKKFADNIKAICNAQAEIVTKEFVRQEAADYHEFLHRRTLRSHTPHFSDGFISGLKYRHKIPSRPTKIIRRQTVLAHPDLEEQLVLYSCRVLEAVEKYGAHRVVNMDETPTRIVQVPRTGWACSEKGYAEIQSTGNEKDCVT
jgi:hypothetical protein